MYLKKIGITHVLNTALILMVVISVTVTLDLLKLILNHFLSALILMNVVETALFVMLMSFVRIQLAVIDVFVKMDLKVTMKHVAIWMNVATIPVQACRPVGTR